MCVPVSSRSLSLYCYTEQDKQDSEAATLLAPFSDRYNSKTSPKETVIESLKLPGGFINAVFNSTCIKDLVCLLFLTYLTLWPSVSLQRQSRRMNKLLIAGTVLSFHVLNSPVINLD